jgi:hypothetical protein
MKLRVLYCVIGLLLCTGGFGYWQHRQEQRQLQWKLRLLDATLQIANERAHNDALATRHKMHQSVRLNSNQPRDLGLLRQVDTLNQRADKAVKIIRTIRHDLLTQKLSSTAKVTKASARAGQEVLNYLYYIRQVITDPTSSTIPFASIRRGRREQLKLPLDDKKAELQALIVEHSQHGWGLGNSLSEQLATLTQQEATIREYERLALQHQGERIGFDRDIVYDAYGAFASAESNTVAVGEQHKAELFMTTVYGLPVLEMTVNGKPIPVGPDKHGRVEFTVPPEAGKAPGGQAYWTGRIRTIVKGRDSTFVVKVAYTVRPH